MPWFYIDANGMRQGPVNRQQIQSLVTQGVIVPTTIIENDNGIRSAAGQIPNLFPAAPQVPPVAPRVSTPPLPPGNAPPNTSNAPAITLPPLPPGDMPQITTEIPGLKRKRPSILSWLMDFSFSDIRLPIILPWICRILYVIIVVSELLGALIYTAIGGSLWFVALMNSPGESIISGFYYRVIATVLSPKVKFCRLCQTGKV